MNTRGDYTLNMYLRLGLLSYLLFVIKHIMTIISTYPSTFITMVCQPCTPQCYELRNVFFLFIS